MGQPRYKRRRIPHHIALSDVKEADDAAAKGHFRTLAGRGSACRRLCEAELEQDA
jgi:hypothetical protein